MASSAKKKTTMAKRNRENAVRERRARKQARKDARKQAAAEANAAPTDTIADVTTSGDPVADVDTPSAAELAADPHAASSDAVAGADR